MISWGHDFPFGFLEVPEKERLHAVRAAGFDAVMIHWGAMNGVDACARYDAVVQAGLDVHTVHFPQEHTADFWREGDAGDRLTDQAVQAVREIGERGIAHMVVHTTRRLETPEPGPIGARRFARIAEAGEKYGVNIALENTRFLHYNQYLFRHIDSPRLRFCYDCGHNHCFTPGEDALGMFADRLVTTHLHDNHGARDEHLLIGEGDIDLPALFLRLVRMGVDQFNLESRYIPAPGKRPWTLGEYIEKAYRRLRRYTEQAETDFHAGNGVEDTFKIL